MIWGGQEEAGVGLRILSLSLPGLGVFVAVFAVVRHLAHSRPNGRVDSLPINDLKSVCRDSSREDRFQIATQ